MAKSDVKAAFARHADGLIVHVDDVRRGLKCECTCLHCKGLMIARQGRVQAHHFAHHGPYCGGGMTWLHRTAQEILTRERTIILPTRRYGLASGMVTFVDVIKEANIGSRRVDCLGLTDTGARIAIEIRVTHEVDDEKLRDFRSQNIAAVEVDLRHLSKALPDWDMLREAICDSNEHIQWLHDPDASEKELAAMRAFEAHTRDLAQQLDVGPFSDEYDLSAVYCWKCDAATPVFEWTKERTVPALPADEDTEPPEPIPRTLSIGYSYMAGVSYWGNRCVECNMLQGDFYLFQNKMEYADDWFDRNGNGVSCWDV